ncbi:MAG: adenylate/guanylate cyclase domain-containing protein [Proteobacteria bacterium]|nr:adenylate/guanylate cyclase domain-containing protein [Pseudomonadota bacterium]
MLYTKHWPNFLEYFKPYYWQLGVLVNLPFLFSVFLLKNEFSQIWVLSMLVSTILLTFFVDWISAIILFILGTTLAWYYYTATTVLIFEIIKYLEILLISFFALVMGGTINYRLLLYRSAQRNVERKIMMISNQNKYMVRQYNQILSRFLNNIVVQRLIKLQDEHGLDTAIKKITKRERRFCGIMQADIRNFTKMLQPETEYEVARLISQCFEEITNIGQDLAVIKPVGDCIFVYCDDENGKDLAVSNILALSLLFVNSVEKINKKLIEENSNPLNFGIALHAGEVIYGNLASETFIDPTIIGLNVNQTARLEELTKAFEIKNILGPNGIILSEEFSSLVHPYFDTSRLISFDLKKLGITVRDFPDIRFVAGIDKETAVSFGPMVETYLHKKDTNHKMDVNIVDKNSYQGVEYYYEMEGIGAGVSWKIIINITGFSQISVETYVSRYLRDLDCDIGDGVEKWLEISTTKSFNNLDEFEIETKIIEIIEGLIGKKGSK